MVDKYADAFGVDADWIMHGDNPQPEAVVGRSVSKDPGSAASDLMGLPHSNACVWVQHYGKAADEPVPFTAGLLSRLGIPPSAAKVVAVDADSASNDLAVGDAVLLDTDDKDITVSGVFAVRGSTGRVSLRQLRYLVGTEPPRVLVVVGGDHPHDYPVEVSSLIGIGRARWVGRTI